MIHVCIYGADDDNIYPCDICPSETKEVCDILTELFNESEDDELEN